MFSGKLQRRTRSTMSIARPLRPPMLPTQTFIGRSTRSSFARLTPCHRPLSSKLARFIAIASLAVFLFLISLFAGVPIRLPSVPFRATPIEVEMGIPLNRISEPKYYDYEPRPPNWEYRTNAVKQAFLHAYHAYEAQAFPADELWPLSNKPRQNFNAWGVSVVDAMDTMVLMGLTKEFDRALVHVSNMTFNAIPGHHAHFFETTIRYLGGLLSAHALSDNPILLKKADELGRRLLPAFDTPSGLPTYAVNPQTGEGFGGPNPPRVLLAEIASCQLEFRYLAHMTGRAEYYRVVNHVNGVLQMSQNRRNDSLWASYWETENGTQLNNHISVGAWADSAYEYILKQYLQTSGTEARFKRMYMRLTRGILETLLFLSPTRNLLYVTDTVDGYPTRRFEHLSCFYPGLLALGAHSLSDDPSTQLHRWAAEGLAHTCWTLYGESTTGLAPEEAQFQSRFLAGAQKNKVYEERWIQGVREWEVEGKPGGKPPGVRQLAGLVKKGTKDYTTRAAAYYLRPETIETMYLMWKTTGDEVWRERGWFIFKAIEKHCRLRAGYASLGDVEFADPLVVGNKLDDMPSYALAETWKYLYLMFLEADLVPLDKWVFNTEAHPLPVFEWYETEKQQYGIR